MKQSVWNKHHHIWKEVEKEVRARRSSLKFGNEDDNLLQRGYGYFRMALELIDRDDGEISK